MLAKLKKIDPRIIGVLCYVAAIVATKYLGPSIGLHGDDLKNALMGEGAIGTALALLLKSPVPEKRKEASDES